MDDRSTADLLAEDLSFPDDRETELLLACARNRLDAESIRWMQSIAAEGEVDWTLLVRRAIDHGLTPLVARNLALACYDSLPAELASALAAWLSGNRERNLQLTREVLRIIETLEQQDISPIPIKGPVLAKILYGDVALRQSGDLDLLVPRNEVHRVLEILGGLGYHPRNTLTSGQYAAYRRYYSDLELELRGQDIAADVHWNLSPPEMAIRFDLEGMWERARRIPFEGLEVLSLSAEDYLIFLCVHGSKHLWYRLTWICDIHEFVNTQTTIEWSRCLHLARNQGCERMLLLGLRLAESLLGTAIADSVRDRMTADPKVEQLAVQMQSRLFQAERQPNVLEAFRPFLPLRERLRDKWLYCWRHVVTPRVDHFGIVQLPPRLWFLYVPIKLGYDYAWRPLTQPWRKRPA